MSYPSQVIGDMDDVEHITDLFANGAFLDGLYALRDACLSSKNGELLARMETQLHAVAVSYAVLAAAAHGLGWSQDKITAMGERGANGPRDEGGGLEWLQAALPSIASEPVEHCPLAALRAAATAAAGGGCYREAARIYGNSMRQVVPQRQPPTHVQLGQAVPDAIGSVSLDAGVAGRDSGQIRKLFDNGSYRRGLAILTRDFKATGEVTTLVATRAGLKEIRVSMHVLKRAAERLGWSKDKLHALELCRAEVRPEEARSWWCWLQQKLATLVGSQEEPIVALLESARELVERAVDVNSVAAVLPRSPEGRLRAQIIEAEAALATGKERWAKRLLTDVSERAPHVTSTRLRLGRMAYKEHQGLEAARHFEAAMLSPNTGDWMADQAETSPCRMITLKGEWDVYCFRGMTFVAHRDKRAIGLTFRANRLFAVRDTLGFRQCRRVVQVVRHVRLRPRSSGSGRCPPARVPFGRTEAIVRLLDVITAWLPPRIHTRLMFAVRQGMRALVQRTSVSFTKLLAIIEIAVLRYWIGAKPLQSLQGPNVIAGIFRAVRYGSS